MSIRSWFERRRRQQDEAAAHEAEENAFESADERAHGDRWGMAADNRISRRVGRANIDDVDRLGSGEFPR
jgi:hypothetical protein